MVHGGFASVVKMAWAAGTHLLVCPWTAGLIAPGKFCEGIVCWVRMGDRLGSSCSVGPAMKGWAMVSISLSLRETESVSVNVRLRLVGREVGGDVVAVVLLSSVGVLLDFCESSLSSCFCIVLVDFGEVDSSSGSS